MTGSIEPTTIFDCREVRSNQQTREDREAAISKYLKQGRVTAEKSVAKRAAQKAADAAWRKQMAERRKEASDAS